jgi:imidazolonepropionase-like amidohydrolase
MENILLIKNGKVLTMADKEYGCADVLIKDGKIAAVGENIDGKGARVIDASGCTVMPGLVECHCHLGITEEKKGFEGDDCNEKMYPITPHLKALNAVNPMDSAFHCALSAGITSVMIGPGSSNIVGGQFVLMKTHGRSIDNMVIKEPSAMKIAFGENPKRNYFEKGRMPSTRMAIAAMLEDEIYKAIMYFDKKAEKQKKGEFFESRFRYESWKPVLTREIPLKAHVHRADDILTAIRIAKKYNLDMTLEHCTEGHLIAREIKESGFPAVIGPSLASRNKIEVQFMDFKTAGILHDAGVKVSIMTDHPVSRIKYLPVCAGFAAKEGLGIKEGLKAITINAAQICRASDRIGSIEVGKDGDIAIYDGNPMETFTNTLYTIINGEIAYDAQKNKF